MKTEMPHKKTKRQRPRVGRPATGKQGSAIKLYLPSGLLPRAKRFAFERNTSLSKIVTALLLREINNGKISP